MTPAELSHADLTTITESIINMLRINEEWDCPTICSEIAELLDHYDLLPGMGWDI